jgi:ankyrin repeat protein
MVEHFVEKCPQLLKVVNHSGFTPLYLACLGKAPLDIVKLLVERDQAALKTRANNGDTPLDCACVGGT